MILSEQIIESPIKSILDQLWEFYQEEKYHKNRIDKVEADKYHDKLIRTGNILTVSEGNILCGYVEIWRLNYEQLGRIICGEWFSAYLEDVQHGNIAWVGNTYIRPEYRKGEVYNMLKDRFREVTKDCRYYSGRAQRKSAWMIKMFKNRRYENVR